MNNANELNDQQVVLLESLKSQDNFPYIDFSKNFVEQTLTYRIPEPEIMNELDQVDAYSNADFSRSHQWQVDKLKEFFPELNPRTILDLGCGSGDITRRVAVAYPKATLLAVDGAPNMISRAIEQTTKQGLADRISYKKIYLPFKLEDIAAMTAVADFVDLVLCTNIFHHLNSTDQLWSTIESTAKTNTTVFITDLIRPNTLLDALILVKELASNEPVILQRDLFNSLLASYQVAEVSQQIKERFPWLSITQISKTHFAVFGQRM